MNMLVPAASTNNLIVSGVLDFTPFLSEEVKRTFPDIAQAAEWLYQDLKNMTPATELHVRSSVDAHVPMLDALAPNTLVRSHTLSCHASTFSTALIVLSNNTMHASILKGIDPEKADQLGKLVVELGDILDAIPKANIIQGDKSKTRETREPPRTR